MDFEKPIYDCNLEEIQYLLFQLIGGPEADSISLIDNELTIEFRSPDAAEVVKDALMVLKMQHIETRKETAE